MTEVKYSGLFVSICKRP